MGSSCLTISIIAAIISTISLVRTRELAKEQLELEKVTAELSRLQIESITEQKQIRLSLNLM